MPKSQAKISRKGIYKEQGKFRVKIWDATGKHTHVGYFETFDEAIYKRQVALYGHHWKGMGVMSKDNFGFIYKITEKKTGRMYIGKKQFYYWDGPVGGYKCTDPRSKWWDSKAWKDGKWRHYVSSSMELRDLIASRDIHTFDFEVIQVCVNKLHLHVSEVRHQIELNVLEEKMENGEYLYFNKNIASMEFRPPYDREEAEVKVREDMEAVRNYYLKPAICTQCGLIIEYRGKCCEVKKVGREEVLFDDIRT